MTTVVSRVRDGHTKPERLARPALAPTLRRPLSRRTSLLVCSGVAVLLVVFVPTSPTVASGSRPVKIGLFGDSLAVLAEPYFNFLVEAGGKATVRDFAYGGTAACDWLSKMRKYARTEHPRAVVFEFVGNTFTSCMKGCRFGSPAAVTLYCTAISISISVFLGLGTHVFLVDTPITRAQSTAHDSVEGPRHSFVSTLPCLFFEACTGPTIAGVRTNVVRSPDGVHLCRDQISNAVGVVPGCDSYSSGAFRFAAAMAGPVIREFGFAESRQD